MLAFGSVAAQEMQSLQPIERTESYVGTVRSRDVNGLSYGVRGCIAQVSEDALRNQVASAGQVLVELDDSLSQLALKTAEARVADLKAAVEERDLSLAAAEADVRRRGEELAFVAKEFERNQTMFRRGLINETTMEAVERRMMDARFAAEQAKEAMAAARSARARAEIAVQIGELDLETTRIDHAGLVLTAPFDGVLVGFEPRVGACVTEGALAAQLYDPKRKAVDVYVLISRLTRTDATAVTRGAQVTVRRGNGAACGGQITWIDTEADLESQYVKATIDLDETCAPQLFLNEAVEVEMPGGGDLFRVPAGAVLEGTAYLGSGNNATLEPVAVEIVNREGETLVVRLPGAAGRQIAVDALDDAVTARLDGS
ncbi:efflux RND transporter periplasmic adaptor subunit [Sagittula salina]|uniref:HlyD family efflux transporter periplasmic adaptor subunit n=1 Tax=Sagittula salina TaxID=2820268 RepID=A0A940MVA3_9RHOB|nr:HlyD family secretion protein [Sagittula salina]MBP0483554.1 HlyD family efflux transporter periplasmic adaptor subunit [Sagittula salina]